MQVIQRTNKLNHKKRSSFASGFFLHLFAIALRLPNSNGEQETQSGRVLPAAVLPLRDMLAFLPFAVLSFGLFGSVPVFAASSTLNLDLASDTISVDIGSANANGTFKKSANNTISVTTDHYTGYTLSIKSTDTSASTISPALKNGSDTMPSITSSLTEEQFSSISATNYNNKYGYLPSRICTNTNGCTSNTSFLPAPTLTGDILDKTSSANPTANTYTMAIGARIDQTIPFGSYSNTFEVLLVANAIPYTIIYNDSVIGNMPVDVDTTSATSNINLSDKVPTRQGYTFNGWCTTAVGNNGTGSCSGTTYSAGQQITLSSTTPNNLTLYAMWTADPMGGLEYMQDIAKLSDSERYALIKSMPIGEDYTLLDQRDNKKYHFSRLCTQYVGTTCVESQIWMTQNLDFVIDTTKTYTHADTDLGWSPATFDANATWAPNSTLTNPARLSSHNAGDNTITGWTNDNNVPYQSEGDDYYVYTSGNNNADTILSSLSACTAAHSETECEHYHVGNYYNFSATVASNNTSGDTTDLTVMPNSICPAGWRLPNGLTKNSGLTTVTEFNKLAAANGITNGTTIAHSSESDRWVNVGWATNGFNNFRANSLYFVRSGFLNGSTLYLYGTYGRLWSSTVRSASWGYYLEFNYGALYPAAQEARFLGFPVRCVVR
ncbi:InlB B-repeat-containing protein [Candidatus Saccharibacteria bacterium]|nr:InlB B-repeat-containing protein [Candidatus Saccharibacteria bacterium]